MSACAVKRGIITLRDCGNEATDTCSVCARPICRDHMKLRGTDIFCVECYARQQQQDAAAGAQQKGSTSAKAPKAKAATPQYDPEDDTWAYSYRHYYYSNFFYHPFYTGSYWNSYYDDYDVRSFSQGMPGDPDGDDTTAGGFYDS